MWTKIDEYRRDIDAVGGMASIYISGQHKVRITVTDVKTRTLVEYWSDSSGWLELRPQDFIAEEKRNREQMENGLLEMVTVFIDGV